MYVSYCWNQSEKCFSFYKRGRLGVSLFIYLFICWRSRVGVFFLCSHSTAPRTSKGEISASAIWYLCRIILVQCIGSGGGWLYLYSFICLSTEVVEWQPYCFVVILLHHAPPKVTSVLVLFVIFEVFS